MSFDLQVRDRSSPEISAHCPKEWPALAAKIAESHDAPNGSMVKGSAHPTHEILPNPCSQCTSIFRPIRESKRCRRLNQSEANRVWRRGFFVNLSSRDQILNEGPIHVYSLLTFQGVPLMGPPKRKAGEKRGWFLSGSDPSESFDFTKRKKCVSENLICSKSLPA